MPYSVEGVEEKRGCLFLTLFPTSLSVQFTIILTCHERTGWYPTCLALHPERYARCEQTTLYLPLPQDRVQAYIAQHPGELPLLDDLLSITLTPDPHLLWYQVQCSA